MTVRIVRTAGWHVLQPIVLNSAYKVIKLSYLVVAEVTHIDVYVKTAFAIDCRTFVTPLLAEFSELC